MAKVKLEATFDARDFLIFRKIADSFPEIRAEMLGYVGSAGRKILFRNFLRGQELNYKNPSMRDRRGRDTVSYTITRGAKGVKIRSYPLNFFEKGRTLRDGTRETGKFIITKKLKSVMSARLSTILNGYDKKYLQKELNKIK